MSTRTKTKIYCKQHQNKNIDASHITTYSYDHTRQIYSGINNSESHSAYMFPSAADIHIVFMIHNSCPHFVLTSKLEQFLEMTIDKHFLSTHFIFRRGWEVHT